MTTTIRQSKAFSGVVNEGDIIDLTFEDPTTHGSVLFLVYFFEAPGLNAQLGTWHVDSAEEIVDNMDAITGWGGRNGRVSGDFVGGMGFAPAQPIIEDFQKFTVEAGGGIDLPLEAMLYEVGDTAGPIVPYGSYNFEAVTPLQGVEYSDWVSVHTGYNKPRPLFTVGVNPSGSFPDMQLPIEPGFLRSGHFSANYGDVQWAAGEHNDSNISTDGFVLNFVGVTQQSNYETVQHLETENTNDIAPAAVGEKHLLLMSARYKNEVDFALDGWNILSKTCADDEDQLTAVVWWKWSTDDEPATFTVPGTPLNLNFREVSGFPDGIRLATYAKLDTTMYASAPSDASYGDPWYKENAGVGRLGDFPDNDAYFYSAVSFDSVQSFSMSLPEPRVKLNRSFIDTGDGWDFFPDGYGSFGIITVMSSDMRGSTSTSPVAAVGAVFFNAAPASTVVSNPRWNRIAEPNLNYLFRYITFAFNQVSQQIGQVETNVQDQLNQARGLQPWVEGKFVQDLGDSSGGFTVPIQYAEVKVMGSNVGPYNIGFANPGAGKFVRFRLVMDLSFVTPVVNTYQFMTAGSDAIEATGTWEVCVVGGESDVAYYTCVLVD